MTVLVGFCSLAVDYGRAQLVRSELQSCADGAARAAATGIFTNIAEAKTRARAVGNLNRAAGESITFADGDFVFGKWNDSTGVIDTSATPVDAVQVTARRNVSLVFGSVFGKSAVDVSAQATARAPTGGSYRGFVGLNGVSFKNNAYIGSYRSSVTTSPTPASSTGKGIVSSNVIVEFWNNATVSGNIVLGPAGNVAQHNNLTVTGSTVKNPAPFTPPPDPTWSPTANPGGVPQNYTVNSNTTLPGGTYWFTSLTVNKRLTFSGPATVYVNGNVYTDDSIVTYQNKPSNFKLYVLGNNRTIDLQKDISLYGEVQAPGADLVANNKLFLYGAGVFKSIESKNNSDFYFDEDATSAAAAAGVTLVR
jgi:hypothetical protein